MDEVHLLEAVRGRLLQGAGGIRVHLALPPNTALPVILVELVESWSNGASGGVGILGRVTVQITLYGVAEDRKEILKLSANLRQTLEGASLPLPEDKVAILRLLECQMEKRGNAGGFPSGERQPSVIHHRYEAIVRR